MGSGWILDGSWVDSGWLVDRLWMDSEWSLYPDILDGFWVHSGWNLGAGCVVLPNVSTGSQYASWILGELCEQNV